MYDMCFKVRLRGRKEFGKYESNGRKRMRFLIHAGLHPSLYFSCLQLHAQLIQDFFYFRGFCQLILTSESAKKVKVNTWQNSNVPEIMEGVDCVVFPGGKDISPTLFYDEQESQVAIFDTMYGRYCLCISR